MLLSNNITVLRDLLRREICDGTRIAVIATTVARTSINSLLVNSRGTHFVHTTLAINPPDKVTYNVTYCKTFNGCMIFCVLLYECNYSKFYTYLSQHNLKVGSKHYRDYEVSIENCENCK